MSSLITQSCRSRVNLEKKEVRVSLIRRVSCQKLVLGVYPFGRNTRTNAEENIKDCTRPRSPDANASMRFGDLGKQCCTLFHAMKTTCYS
jgi:hypothetical protein